MKFRGGYPLFLSKHDYEPYGSALPYRGFEATKTEDKYKFGFNGKENDKEIGTSFQDYGFRKYNAQIGRFLSVDPLTSKYPELTPYQFASNRPIDGVDLDGLEYAPGGTFLPGGLLYTGNGTVLQPASYDQAKAQEQYGAGQTQGVVLGATIMSAGLGFSSLSLWVAGTSTFDVTSSIAFSAFFTPTSMGLSVAQTYSNNIQNPSQAALRMRNMPSSLTGILLWSAAKTFRASDNTANKVGWIGSGIELFIQPKFSIIQQNFKEVTTFVNLGLWLMSKPSNTINSASKNSTNSSKKSNSSPSNSPSKSSSKSSSQSQSQSFDQNVNVTFPTYTQYHTTSDDQTCGDYAPSSNQGKSQGSTQTSVPNVNTNQ